MMWLVAFAICNAILFVLLARIVYGSWPWEYRKTWYCTEQVIEFLRQERRDRLAAILFPRRAPLHHEGVISNREQ